jgi:threonine/homoserine/homoserine lactone efflux protein
MTLETLSPLLLFAFVSTITPGAATTLATASGAHFGFFRSMPMMAGCALGLGSIACAAAVGLGALLAALPALQISMKVCGSVYLAWLAFRISRSGPPHLDRNLARPTGFVAGVWLLWHNPKGWAMTTSAAASFAVLANGPLPFAALLGATFGLVAVFSLAVWCIAGQLLSRRLKTDRQWRTLNFMLAGLLVLSLIPMWF